MSVIKGYWEVIMWELKTKERIERENEGKKKRKRGNKKIDLAPTEANGCFCSRRGMQIRWDRIIPNLERKTLLGLLLVQPVLHHEHTASYQAVLLGMKPTLAQAAIACPLWRSELSKINPAGLGLPLWATDFPHHFLGTQLELKISFQIGHRNGCGIFRIKPFFLKVFFSPLNYKSIIEKVL